MNRLYSGTIAPRPGVTARDVIAFRFPPRHVVLRQEWRDRGGSVHLAFRNAS